MSVRKPQVAVDLCDCCNEWRSTAVLVVRAGQRMCFWHDPEE